MEYRELENMIKEEIKHIFTKIIEKNNFTFKISANSRAGAEISDFLENEFVKYGNNNDKINISEFQSSEKKNTKSPFDFKFDYTFNEFHDTIWGDIKATKQTQSDSNPDLGTPTKLIKFINEGHFYILFVFVEYIPIENGIRFVKFEDGSFVKCIFLKDFDNSLRINPKPQFQININFEENYRTHLDFLDLFKRKYKESLERNIKNAESKLIKLDSEFEELEKNIKFYIDKNNLK